MATGKENKVKFGLTNVHVAKIQGWSEDGLTPTYGTPFRVPGAVNLSLDPNGESEKFYADNTVYFIIKNNSGYEGDLEIAMVTQKFAIDILSEKLDNNGVLVETNNAETVEFALFFEFEGDVHHIRHILYRCSVARPSISGKTNEESKEPQTDSLSLTAAPLPNGLVKSKTVNSTDDEVYNNWFDKVYIPDFSPDSLSVNSQVAVAVTEEAAAKVKGK